MVLIIAPWNYPVQLLVTPLAAALAAGNAVVCKPSEVAPATSAALARLLPEYVDPAAVAVVEGGIPETTALLEQQWDHILYTGNGTVGRIVAEAAAKHLTPVTLELGGKSPAIVTEDANLKLAASKVAFAKFLNSGQTCVAVDHVFVHESVEAEFLRLVQAEIVKRFGSEPRTSKDFGRMVNAGHTQRVQSLLGGDDEVVCGGEVDVDGRYVAPTILRGVTHDLRVMGEEIFGPVLPVLTYRDLGEVTGGDPVRRQAAGALPVHHFRRDDRRGAQAPRRPAASASTTRSTTCSSRRSPSAGSAPSGYGAYHGRWGFETFSHRKAVLARPAWALDPPLLYPPYTRLKTRLMRRLF